MHAFSLFTGIGGFDLAWHWAGGETVAFCEIDPYCQAVLASKPQWADVPIFGDIHALGATDEDIRASLRERGIDPEHIDLIFGGPPCQPASQAGKRQGERDARWLWPEFLRVVGAVRPRWVLAENPVGILTVDHRRAFGSILRSLATFGYRVGWETWGVADLGGPHQRNRVFIVGNHERDVADTGRGQRGRRSGATPGWNALPEAACGDDPGGRDTTERTGHALADAMGRGPRCRTASWPGGQPAQPGQGFGDHGDALAHADRDRRGHRSGESLAIRGRGGAPDVGVAGASVADATGDLHAQEPEVTGREPPMERTGSGTDGGVGDGHPATRVSRPIRAARRSERPVANPRQRGWAARKQPLQAGQPNADGTSQVANPQCGKGGKRCDLASIGGRSESAQQARLGSRGGRNERGDESADECGAVVVYASGPGREECDAPAEPGSAGHVAGLFGATDDIGAGATGRAEPGVGGGTDELPAWLDCARWVAGPSEAQADWEPPRVTHERVPSRAARLTALGNAVDPIQVYPLLAAIAAAIRMEREAEREAPCENEEGR